VIIHSSGANMTPLLVSAANTSLLLFAYRHVSNFWKDKAKVPLAQSYNDGIRSSQQMLQTIGVLGISWALATAIYLVRAVL
jgi:hypothetical protein